MNFLNSIALWGGLAAAAVAVPIIIHLLHQKHKRTMDWAAIELLRKAIVVRSGQVRLEDFLLLFLRCLVLALVAFALARPTLSSRGGAIPGLQQRVGAVVAIDASYSMAHGSLGSRFEDAKRVAREIMGTFSVGDPATVMLMGNGSRMLLRATAYDERRFAAELEQAAVLPVRLNLERSLAELSELVQELKTPIREGYIVTDAQASDWASLSAEARAQMAHIASFAKLFIVPVTVRGEENLAITGFEYSSGPLRRAGMARFSAEVRNFGRRPMDGAATFYVNDQPIMRQPVGAIEPGAARVLSFFTTFDEAGERLLKVGLGPDELSLDNTRYAVVAVPPRINVLCVDGAPAGRESDSETYFLVRALRLKQAGSKASLNVVRVNWQDFPAEKLSEYDVIVMANVPAIDDDSGKRLDRFVSHGGGLILFGGDQVDPESYNASLLHEGRFLLPGRLESSVKSETAAPWHLGPVQSSHVLANLARSFPAEQLDEVRFQKVMKMTPANGGAALLSLAGLDLPILLEKRTGRGTVLFFTSTADRDWSNLAIHPLYPMLVQQAITHLTARPGDRQFLVDDQARAVVEGALVGAEAAIRDPAGHVSAGRMVVGEGSVSECPVPSGLPGLYQVVVAGRAPSSLAVNVDPREADVKVLDSAAVEKQVANEAITVTEPGAPLAGIIRQQRVGRELSKMLLILAAILFFVQAWLARTFTRRMRVGEQDVTDSERRQSVAAARKG